ncbi:MULTISPECIES: hypothetical protein [Hymenobacter]|uniref:IS66 family transposase n=2 Tax=Hymenobacter TaxID=89966 RepID=A0ABS6WV24_9BACT|nr:MULTISPECIES: hypothetical protein [Hymenobacter]MBO3271020.1 hypothetical protein [Hymenobacter defluvii]MBW3127419.1 hypothetical protein [Hymenobacter profundi]QNE39725.1 hypothetical protein F1C16_09250 [Hymenobacter sp. NBH84]
MATMDIARLQEIVDNAATNEQLLNQIRKNVTKVNSLLEELNEMLQPGYTPTAKERKPRAEGARKPGRPRKAETAE